MTHTLATAHLRPSTRLEGQGIHLHGNCCACGKPLGPAGRCADCQRRDDRPVGLVEEGRQGRHGLHGRWPVLTAAVGLIQRQTTEEEVGSAPTLPVEPAAPQATPTEELAAPTEGAAEAGGAAAGSVNRGTCSPRALSRADFLRQPGTQQDDFGLTTLEVSQVTFPQVTLARTRGALRLQPTSAALPTIPSVYTGQGTFTEGERIFMGSPACDAGRYPVRWIITPQGAQKIAAGEQEHCSDYQYAFDVSLARYAQAVNQLATAGTSFASQATAERRLAREVGTHPRDWQARFVCLACKTKIRDRNGSHTPRPRIDPPVYPCQYTRAWISDASLPRIGQTPSNQIITGCDTEEDRLRTVRQCSRTGRP